MEPRADSWHQKRYIHDNVGELIWVVDKACQLDWLHKYRKVEYEAAIKGRVVQIANSKGYYKGIYVDAATDVQEYPYFKLKVNRGLSWMDEFKNERLRPPCVNVILT